MGSEPRRVVGGLAFVGAPPFSPLWERVGDDSHIERDMIAQGLEVMPIEPVARTVEFADDVGLADGAVTTP